MVLQLAFMLLVEPLQYKVVWQGTEDEQTGGGVQVREPLNQEMAMMVT